MSWVPVHACSLPTAEQPLRVREFDTLFADALRRISRVGSTSASFELVGDADVEHRAADLAARETSCCSFFDFAFERTSPSGLTMRITVPSEHVEVLDALVERTSSLLS